MDSYLQQRGRISIYGFMMKLQNHSLLKWKAEGPYQVIQIEFSVSSSTLKTKTYWHLLDGIILFKSMICVIVVPCTLFGVLMYVEIQLLSGVMAIQWLQEVTVWRIVLRFGISECLKELKSLIGQVLVVISWSHRQQKKLNWKICQNQQQKESWLNRLKTKNRKRAKYHEILSRRVLLLAQVAVVKQSVGHVSLLHNSTLQASTKLRIFYSVVVPVRMKWEYSIGRQAILSHLLATYLKVFYAELSRKGLDFVSVLQTQEFVSLTSHPANLHTLF